MITAEELEKLFELKEKSDITEEEFNKKRDEYLSDNNTYLTQCIKPVNKVLLAGILCIIGLVSIIYFTSNNFTLNKSINQNVGNKSGQDGFIASIECRFGMMGGSYAAVPFQSCAMYGEIVVISGNSRHSYSEYQIPETIYLSQHFQMGIDNASDKFTTIVKIIDKKTRNVVAVREVGPNSYDMIQN